MNKVLTEANILKRKIGDKQIYSKTFNKYISNDEYLTDKHEPANCLKSYDGNEQEAVIKNKGLLLS